MLVVTNALPSSSRASAAVALLGALLLTTILTLLSQHDSLLSQFSVAGGSILAILLIVAGITLAPMLDRARAASLIIAAPVAAFIMVGAMIHAGITHRMLLPCLMIAASLAALMGSAFLSPHPLRYTALGQLRPIAVPQALLLVGWVMMGGAVLMLIRLLSPETTLASPLLSAIVAAFAALLTARAEDGLGKAGEAFLAGILIACISPVSFSVAPCLGLLAALFVNRSEAISCSVQVDDPQHFIGAVLLPAAFGLLMPGLFDMASLATQLTILAT
ncbi:MAG: hypothetical protein ACOYNL_10335, partial [Rickettsiales bacterium]